MKKINQKYWENNENMLRSNKKFLDSRSYPKINKKFWENQKSLKVYKKSEELKENLKLDKNMIMDFKGVSFYPENELYQCKISTNIYNDVKFISNLNYRRFGEKYIYGYYLLDHIPEQKKKKEIKYNKYYYIGCKKREEAAKEILRLKKVLQELKKNLANKKNNKFIKFINFIKKLFIN